MWGGHEGVRDGAGPQLQLHRDDSTPLRRRRSIHKRPAEHARSVVGSIHTPYRIPCSGRARKKTWTVHRSGAYTIDPFTDKLNESLCLSVVVGSRVLNAADKVPCPNRSISTPRSSEHIRHSLGLLLSYWECPTNLIHPYIPERTCTKQRAN